MSENFNPLDDKNIQKSFLNKLEETEIQDFTRLHSVVGQGVYFIWSNNLPYEFDKSKPVYVGKAVSSGGRKGQTRFSTSPLKKRLMEHMNSIKKTENLDIKDFTFKTIPMDEHWTVYAEQLFIKTLNPLWNSDYDGFGNHAVGSTRSEQKMSKWDVTHPGRLTYTVNRGTVTRTATTEECREGE